MIGVSRQEYIQSVINELTANEKKRLRKAEKQQTHEYVYFTVATFNAGMVVGIRQTNKFIEKKDDGFSFYLPQSELSMFDLS